MLKTDKYAELAHCLAVRSLPLRKIFRNDAVIDCLQNVDSDTELRTFLNKFRNSAMAWPSRRSLR